MDTAVSRVFYRHYFFLNVQDIFLFFEGRRALCGTLTCLYRRGLWCFVMQRLRPGFIVEISRTLLGRRVFAERGEMCLNMYRSPHLLWWRDGIARWKTGMKYREKERENENATSWLGGVAPTASVLRNICFFLLLLSQFLNNKFFFLSLQVSVLLENKVFVWSSGRLGSMWALVR